eukprot:1158623-Pelagomonas_calceolata.AAC.11
MELNVKKQCEGHAAPSSNRLSMDNQADGHNISKGAQIAVSSCSDMHRVEGHGDKGRMHAARGGIAGRPKRIANVSGAITLFSPTINHMTIAFQCKRHVRARNVI